MKILSKIASVSDAIQFLSTVVSTDATLHHFLESMEASEIMKYALVHEIMSTSKIGSYSGCSRVTLL